MQFTVDDGLVAIPPRPRSPSSHRLDEMTEELDQVNEELAEGPNGAAEGVERRESERRIAERRRRGPDLTT